MIINYTNAPCGAGKSYTAAQRMTSIAGKYLVIRDRVEAIAEYAKLLAGMCGSGGILIETITSGKAFEANSVRARVESLPDFHRETGHVIVLITHAAMMMSDLSQFLGWHAIIDETPPVLSRQDVRSKASYDFLAANYRLEAVAETPGWASVTLTGAGWQLTPADFYCDDLVRPLRGFHERVTLASPPPDGEYGQRIARRVAHEDRRNAVLVNLNDWSEVKADVIGGRVWSWWSLWSPTVLAGFESVEFMANGFEQSLTFALWRAVHPEISWTKRDIASRRQFEPRNVRIQYFAHKHRASATFLASAEGVEALRLIGQHLSDGRSRIWMANEAHAENLPGISGTRLSPRKAGSNEFSDYHEAVCIYSAKPRCEARTVLSLLGIDSDVWVDTHEHETILQFACRTSVREPMSSTDVTLVVYDEDQANYLKRYFDAQAHTSATIELVDLGFAELERSSLGGRPQLNVSEPERKLRRKQQNAEAQRRHREKKRATNPVTPGCSECQIINAIKCPDLTSPTSLDG